jgi:anti-sigma regulatory factor (Ser/Thr protein kinase)
VSQPHRMLFSVPAQPQSAAAARHRLSATLRDWSLPVDLDTAQLLLSEVVTNAIVHGTDSAAGDAVITVELAETRVGLRVEVRDPDQGLPIGSRSVPRDGGRTDLVESGRGLEVVGALAAEWGVLNESSGKRVYFVLGFADDACCGRRVRLRCRGPG